MNKESVKALAKSLGIEDDDIVRATQKKWLRKAKERWEVLELPSSEKEIVLTWAKKENIFDAWKPSRHSYDTALILGATTSRMKKRLAYLVKLWNEGVSFKEVVWLTGERPLDGRVDHVHLRAKTEAEGAKLLWDEESIPEGMRALPVTFVSAPMKNEQGVRKRPNTGDTIEAWVSTVKANTSALFISDQPFCGYQFAVVNTSMPASVDFDLAGEAFDPEAHPAAASITLDTVARWIYQESLK